MAYLVLVRSTSRVRATLNQIRFPAAVSLSYLAFSTIVLLSWFTKSWLGEFADVLGMAGYLWPYPAMFALQSWPSIRHSEVILIAVGLLLVVGFSFLLQRRFASLTTWPFHPLALVLWYIPIFIAQAILMVTVALLGYPIGE